MKFLILSCIIAVVLAEVPQPPRFRPARFRFQRQELAPTTTDSPTEATTTDNAPYPASGWTPDQPFTLPNEAPADAYGAPAAQSGPYSASGWKPAGEPFTLPNEPPATSYGVPDNTYGAPTTDAPAEPTENPQAEKLEGPVEVQKSVGSYFILLPNGQLQEVKFVTENDVQNMRYTARLQLQNRAPLFVFRP